MRHLDEPTYAHLLEGTLEAAEARALARHLEGECPACEAFLASLPRADAVDGLVDRALASLAQRSPAGNDVEFGRIERRRRALADAPRRSPRRIAPAALAAAVLAAGLAGLFLPRGAPDRAGWDGRKGTAPQAIPVRLRFVVITPRPNGPPALEKGVSGQALSAGSSLQFELEVGRSADVALVRVGQHGAPDLVWQERIGPGKVPVSVRGRPAAFPLFDALGPQRFVLVASEERLEPARLARAAAELAPPARVSPDLPGLDGLSLDVVEVDVR